MNIGIIGYGQFGKFIHKIIESKFPKQNVLIFPRGYEKTSNFSDLSKCDIIFPSVPIGEFKNTIKNIKRYLKKDCIIIDICTVKTMPNTTLKKELSSQKYICTHPMFGPYSYQKKGENLDGLRIVITDHNLSKQESKQAKKLLENLGLKILELSSKEHDKLLAETLFLTHLIGQTVDKSGFIRTDIDTVSFGFLMDAVESVKNDTKLFLDVYRFNPYCQKVLKKFSNGLDLVKKKLDLSL